MRCDAVPAAEGPAGVEEVRARRGPRRRRPPRRGGDQVLQGAARYDWGLDAFAAAAARVSRSVVISVPLLLLLLMHVIVVACRRPAGDWVRGDHRRRAGSRGGGALVPALQDGQARGQPQVHLLVGGQGLRSVPSAVPSWPLPPGLI